MGSTTDYDDKFILLADFKESPSLGGAIFTAYPIGDRYAFRLISLP